VLKIDLHVHTGYSKDSLMKISKLLRTAEKKGLNALAITDHNEIAGALALKEISEKIKIIVGEEIRTREGEVTGLFLKERIPPGLPVAETIDLIKNQKGLVYIPHPFDRLRSSAIDGKALEKVIREVDIIEVFNSRNVFVKDNDKAVDLAQKYNLIAAVGSDAHTTWEVGKSYVELEDFHGPEDFLENLKKARLVSSRSSILVHGYTKAIKILGGLVDGGKPDKEIS
jgi:hypothetical protein